MRDYQPAKDGQPGSLLYSFEQTVPIPSYLFAIASGYVMQAVIALTMKALMYHSDIATASIGPRSLVATGPEELKDAKWELEDDTERFLKAAEVCTF